MDPSGERLRVTVEIEPGGELIRGDVLADGAARRFHGWIELTAALEAARAGAARPAGPKPTRTGGQEQ